MKLDSSWKLASPAQELKDRQLHFWSFSIEPEAWGLEEVARCLSDDELKRASRFYFAPDRLHFILARGLLRRLLASYLKVEPSSLAFNYGPNGKPRLAPPFNQSGLQFNLAHSGGRAVVALGKGIEVGVDLEHLRNFADMDAVAECFFSRGEVNALRPLGGLEKPRHFYSLWTCKEAYLKACGEGLIDSLQNIEVELSEEKGYLRFLGSEQDRCFAWPIHRFEPMHGYLAAVTASGAISGIQCFDWLNAAGIAAGDSLAADTVFFSGDLASVHSLT